MHDEQGMRRMGALRKAMPSTAATFIVGWLAIAGVPPFAGFWSKDEILLYAYDASPALWALGLLTALLTAFYMARQVFLVFFGEPRWNQPITDLESASPDDAADAHSHSEPHESPWQMTVPLVVLAGLAIVGGGLNLPFTGDLHFRGRWREPVLMGNEAHIDVATGTKVALAVIAIVAAVGGIVLAAAVYLKHRIKPIEPDVLAKGWNYDSSIAAFKEGPGRAGYQATADFDRTVVDGAVNGVAGLEIGSAHV